jgi:alcohol dehydrogenase (cytochrome c)
MLSADRLLFAALLLAPLLQATAHAQVAAPNFSGTSLANASAGWPTNGGDRYNRRYSPLEEIGTNNVAELRGVWHTKLNGSGVGAKYSAEAQPIFYDGMLFIATAANDVFALDVVSGEIVWSYQARLDPGISTICCGWTNRGVAIGAGSVYLGQLDGKLVALDQLTGDVVWSVQADQEGFTITTAPLYYDGLVITGSASPAPSTAFGGA